MNLVRLETAALGPDGARRGRINQQQICSSAPIPCCACLIVCSVSMN